LTHAIKGYDGFRACFSDEGQRRGHDKAAISQFWNVGYVEAFAADTGHPAGDLERQFADGVVPRFGDRVEQRFVDR
jgi:hypothetical protein